MISKDCNCVCVCLCAAVLLQYEKEHRKLLTQTSEGGGKCPPLASLFKGSYMLFSDPLERL